MKSNRMGFLHEELALILNLYPLEKLSPLWGDIFIGDPWHMQYGISLKGSARALSVTSLKSSLKPFFVTQRQTRRACISHVTASGINRDANEWRLLEIFHQSSIGRQYNLFLFERYFIKPVYWLYPLQQFAVCVHGSVCELVCLFSAHRDWAHVLCSWCFCRKWFLCLGKKKTRHLFSGSW